MIPTWLDDSAIEILAPSVNTEFVYDTNHAPFDEAVLVFLSAFSKSLLKHAEHPDIVALGFWLRDANILNIKRAFLSESESVAQKPIGTVVHFAPANVDTMFIYSWVCSLLLGNANIVRVSQTDSDSRKILLAELNTLFAQAGFQEIANRNVFCTYQHDEKVTQAVCAHADARVIWGGDEAVRNIKHIPAKLTCRDIVFADRYSVSIIDIRGQEKLDALAVSLAKDILPFEQQACSSPRILFCLGGVPDHSLWHKLNEQLQKAENQVWRRNEHLVMEQRLGIENILRSTDYFSHCSVFELKAFPRELLAEHVGQRLLFAIPVSSVTEVIGCLDERCQTLTYWGIDKTELVKCLRDPSITSIDRCVPMGAALEFEPVWDGYNLLSQLSRCVSIK